jgi:hypothetical protein
MDKKSTKKTSKIKPDTNQFTLPSYNQIVYEKPLIVLENPKTDLYKQTKELIFGGSMIWHHAEKTTPNEDDFLHELDSKEEYSNTPFFAHCIIERPNNETPYSKITSYFAENFVKCVKEILDYNNISFYNIYRLNVNMTYYVKNELYTMPHVDHDFPHNNLLIYLDNVTGGEVKVYKNGEWHIHQPKEDDIILFSGLHCHRTPQEPNQFRRAIVTTFI